MSIKDQWRDTKSSINTALATDRLFYSLLIIAVGLLAFWLGRASVSDTLLGVPLRDKTKLPVSQTLTKPSAEEADIATDSQEMGDDSNEPTVNQVNSEATTAKSFVASKNSTKYHLPWCSGAKRIKEENKVWFSSEAEAKATGRTPAANCPGI